MKPYYDADGIMIYHADMFDVPVTRRCDLLLVDPPYSRAGDLHTGMGRGNNVRGRMTASAGSDQFWLHWYRDVVARQSQWIESAAAGFVFCDYKTVSLISIWRGRGRRSGG